MVFLAAVFLLLSFRYFPDRPAESFYATVKHLLSTIPFVFGLTLIGFSLFKKLTGEQLPWNRLLRIFLGFGIFVEFIYGMYDYLSKAV